MISKDFILVLFAMAGFVMQLTFAANPPRSMINRLKSASILNDVILPGFRFLHEPDFIRSVRQIPRPVDDTLNRNHISRRSTCPWHYVTNEDANRFPRRLYEVRCDHNEGCACAHPETRVPVIENLNTCTEVTTPRLVLRKFMDKRTNSMAHDLTLEHLATACTCARPITRQSHPSQTVFDPEN